MGRRPSPRTVLAIASLGGAVAFIDATIVNIAFPDIARSFPGTSISTLSWVLNAYNIVFAAFLLAAAGIADAFGRRRVFVFGLELFTAGSLLCAIARSADALIAFRVVQGLGAALVVPSALALVLNAFPSARRAHGVALFSAAAAAAAGLGPSLGGLLVTAASWRLVFLVNIPIGLAAVLLARRGLVESRAPGRRRVPDLLGTLLFSIAIGTLVLAVSKGQVWGWTSARTVGCLAIALLGDAAVVSRCRSHRRPVLDLSLLRIRRFSVANAMTVIGAAGFYGYTLANVLFLVSSWRYSILQAGLALTAGPLVAVAVAGPASHLTRRIGYRPVLVAGGLIWGGAVMWFVELVGTSPDFAGRWLPGMVLLGIGAGTLFPSLTGIAVASAPGESFATATGMNSVARQIGAALGVAVVISIIGTPTPATAHVVFQHAWAFGAICLFVAGLGCLLTGPVKAATALATAEQSDTALSDTALSGTGLSGTGRAVLAASARPPRPGPGRAIAPRSGDLAVPRAESAAEFLTRTPLFSALETEKVLQLAAKSRVHQLDAGKWLFREQDPGDELYVVRTGRLEVIDEAADEVIGEYRRGDTLGELAVPGDAPRASSVRAVRSAEVIAVNQGDFTELLETSPALSSALNRSLSSQLQSWRRPPGRGRPRSPWSRSVRTRRWPGSEPCLARLSRPTCRSGCSEARRYRTWMSRPIRPGYTGRCSIARRPRTTWFSWSASPARERSRGRGSACGRPTGSWPSPRAGRSRRRSVTIASCKAATWSTVTPSPGPSPDGPPRFTRRSRT
jgi:NTE family protein